MSSKPLLLARIGAAHGVRGEVRVKAFTAVAADIGAYGPLASADGRRFDIEALRPVGGTPDMLVVRFRGIADRNAAEALTGTDLFVARDKLPETGEDEFYHADLVGLVAHLPTGEALGTVISVQNYGAGDVIEVAPPRGPSLLLPFTRRVVPEVDLAGGRIVVDPPPGLIDDAGPDEP